MQARLLSRETGDHSPDDLSKRYLGETEERARSIRAHGAGVSGLAIEKFDGRILVSGGSEGSIKIWDLDEAPTPNQRHVFRPVSTIARSTGGNKLNGHSHGITHLAFYPFDPDAFLSSSYDKSLKLWATQRSCSHRRLRPQCHHIFSRHEPHSRPPPSCPAQRNTPTCVWSTLKSGSAVQALVAHGGPVLCTSWSPRHEHILASGHADGRVRIWDIRRAGGVIAQLDQEDSLGVVHRFRHAAALGQDWSSMPHFRTSAQAHDEAGNGLQGTDDAKYIVSAGLDRKIRVWDAGTGANTLASFGALIQNQHAKTAAMLSHRRAYQMTRRF
ncbi:hypothetical protein J3459_006121 [Metarhizium acridum]|nr:hypothetical protein J3459_006121 [Metarhizium acridum]